MSDWDIVRLITIILAFMVWLVGFITGYSCGKDSEKK
jgi:hypothetical protein